MHTKDGSRVVREFIAQGTAKVKGYTFLMCFEDAHILDTGQEADRESVEAPCGEDVYRRRSAVGSLYCFGCHRVSGDSTQPLYIANYTASPATLN